MNKLKQQFINLYNDVARWNFVAGNTSYDMSDIKNQTLYTQSEIKELEDNQKAYFDTKTARYTAYIDDICDIFVTSAFRDYQLNKFSSCFLYELTPQTKSLKDLQPANTLTPTCALGFVFADWEEFDIIGAIEKVQQSNWSKFIPIQYAGAIADSVEKLTLEHGEVYTVENEGYCIIKRKSDNKILKPTTYFKPQNLKMCLYKNEGEL